MKVQSLRVQRILVVSIVLSVAFLLSYGYAVVQNRQSASAATTAASANGSAVQPGSLSSGSPGSVGASGGGCCGGGGTAAGGAGAVAGGGGCCGGSGPPITKQTTVSGGVQKITVDTSSGSYNPNTIEAKAGIPLEITFTQAAGCLGAVQFPDFNVYEDLSAGPKTISLPALQPGTYSWACGMNMARGQIVVKQAI